jgi:hypothetical protein
MIKLRAYIFLLALFGSAAIAAGCGGGESAAETSSVTRAEFIKAADSICKRADEAQSAELSAYLAAYPNAESSQVGTVKLVAAAGLPPIRSEIEELAELGLPQGEEARVEEIIKGLEKALEESEAAPAKVLDEENSPFAPVESKAAKYGLKECDSPL